MPGSLRPDWQFGAARVRSDGSLIYNAGAVQTVVRTGIGEYSVYLENGSPLEHVPFVEVEDVPGYVVSQKLNFVGSVVYVTLTGLSQFAIAPIDGGFWIEVNRVR